MRLQLFFIVSLLASVHASSSEKRTAAKSPSSKNSFKFSSTERVTTGCSMSSPSFSTASTTRSAGSSSSLPSLAETTLAEELDSFCFNLDGHEVIEESEPLETFMNSFDEDSKWNVDIENFVDINGFEDLQSKFLAEHADSEAVKFILNEESTENTLLDRFVFGRNWDGSGVDETNTRFQMALFKLFMEPETSKEIHLMLSAQVVDFSFPIFDQESGRIEAFLTLMCSRYAYKGNLVKLKQLITNYPKAFLDMPNSASFTPLKIAVKDSKLFVARELVAAGADMNDVSAGNLSPFLESIAMKEKRILAFFLSIGQYDLNVNVVVDGINNNFLSLCMKHLNRFELENILKANREKVLLNQNLAQFMVVLLAQSQEAFVKVVQLMMNDLNMSLALNCLAELAVRKNYPEVIKVLHAEGHDLEFYLEFEDGSMVKLIHLATFQCNYGMACLLLDLGADVNSITSKGHGLIHLAGSVKRIDFIFEFIRRGIHSGLFKLIVASFNPQNEHFLLRVIRESPLNFNTLLFQNAQNIFTAAVSKDFPDFLKAFAKESKLDIFSVDGNGHNILSTTLPDNASAELVAFLDDYRSFVEVLSQEHN